MNGTCKTKKVSVTPWLTLLWIITICVPALSQSLNSSSISVRNLKVFDAVWEAVDKRYFDPKHNGADWLDERDAYRPQAATAISREALYELLNRMLAELHDPHTWVDSPAAVNRKKTHQSVDLGFTGKIIGDRLVMTRIRKGSSAYKAGIKPGWILTSWNRVPVDVSRLSGFAIGVGQAVPLTFLDAQDRERQLQIVAQPFTDVPEQNSRLLDGGVLYIRMESFYADGVGKWFAQTLALNADAPACIVDLRGNSGGNVSELKQTLEPLFVKPAELGRFLERQGHGPVLRVLGLGAKAYKGTLVVLIDEQSLSAAELFAVAIQETGRGRVIGRASGGRALNNAQERLPDGGQLNLSVRDYVTRTGHRIEGQGVKPNMLVTVSLSDMRLNVDCDLEQALRLIR
jgi:carboxyl-terminal processing protease